MPYHEPSPDCPPPPGNGKLTIGRLGGIGERHSRLSLVDVSIPLANASDTNTPAFALDILIQEGQKERPLIPAAMLQAPLTAGQSRTLVRRVLIPADAQEPTIMVRALSGGAVIAESQQAFTADPLPGELEPNDDRFANPTSAAANTGYSGQISSTLDADWFSYTLAPGRSLGLSADGNGGAINLAIYAASSEETSAEGSDDAFAGGLSVTNTTESPINLSIRVACSQAREYLVIFEEIMK
jgi:hypothetical protein